jgi:hypothetical protein
MDREFSNNPFPVGKGDALEGAPGLGPWWATDRSD